MKTKPKISVIIPVYNADRYLRECLCVITEQTIKDIEIICVNDGSRDDSLKIIRDFAEKDPRIKIIDKKNEGANYARRDGFKKSEGEWIAFIDADDIIPKDYLENLTKYETTQADVVMAEAMIIDKRAIPVISQSDDHMLIKNQREIYKLFIMQWIKQADGAHLIPISPWAKIIRKSVLEKNNWYASNYSSGNDSLMMRQVFQNMKGGLQIIEKPLYFYYAKTGGLASRKQITTNTGKTITRLEYEMMRYDTDAEYAKKQNFNLEVDIDLNRLGVLYGYFLNYLTSKTLTSSDKQYIEKCVRNIKLDFTSRSVKKAISENGINYEALESFYATVYREGVDSFITDYFNAIITQKEKELTQKEALLVQKEKELAGVYGSLSWRITNPLRKFKGTIKRRG